MSDLAGKIALITGASKGIGQATALALAGAGCDIAVHYHQRLEGAEATREQVAALGRRAAIVQADVSRSDQVQAMVEQAGHDLGPPDILVNNAGWARPQPVDEISEEDFDAVIAVNLKSAFLCTRAVLPHMRQRGWGRIVNISSGAAHTSGAVGIHYNAAKAGLEGLARGYAASLVQEGVTVNVVAPTFIDTGPERDNAARAKRVPMGRVGESAEVAEAVLLCCRVGYMTGQVVCLNGGMYYR